MLLSDNTGEITAKKWDVSDGELPSLNEIVEGDVVKVKAIVTEWNGMKQLRVLRIRKSVENDGIELSDYIRTAPEPPEDMYAYIMEKIEEFQDEELKALCQFIMEKNKEKLMYYPAASKNHHAELGGLLYHMKHMMMTGERICRFIQT